MDDDIFIEIYDKYFQYVYRYLYVDYIKKNRRLDFGLGNFLSQIKVQDFTDELT